MSRLVATESISLDGVMQAPGGADEDARGGFEHGGWAAPYTDEVMGRAMGERMAKSRGGPLILGRRTYEQFTEDWSQRKDNPYSDALNAAHKHVASRTLEEPLPWENSLLLEGDAVDAVAKLKEESKEDLGLLGSGDLAGQLMRRGLIDEYVLLIHPLVLGTGRHLFPDDVFTKLQLTDSITTTTGVVIGTYRPAE